MRKEWSVLPTKEVQVARVGFAEVMLDVFSLSAIWSIKQLLLANSYRVVSKKENVPALMKLTF